MASRGIAPSSICRPAYAVPLPKIQGHQPVEEILRGVHRRPERDYESTAHDHGPSSDLPCPNVACRHPAVIATRSPLEHVGFAAFEKTPLIRHRIGQRAFGGGAQVVGLRTRELQIE